MSQCRRHSATPEGASRLGVLGGGTRGTEYFVGIEWQKTVSRDAAYWENGLFAKQHTDCRLRSRFTVERVLKQFKLEDDA